MYSKVIYLYSLERLVLKLKFQHFGHLMQRADSLERFWCWERLKVGREVGDRGWDGWMASLIQWTWVWANSGRQWRTRKSGVLQSMGSQRVSHDLATEQQIHICMCVCTHMCVYFRWYSIIGYYKILIIVPCYTVNPCCLSILCYNSLYLLIPYL